MQTTVKTLLSILIGNLCVTGLSHADSGNDNQFKLVLKNAFIERNFDRDDLKDPGSWSQGISGFYNSKDRKSVV